MSPFWDGSMRKVTGIRSENRRRRHRIGGMEMLSKRIDRGPEVIRLLALKGCIIEIYFHATKKCTEVYRRLQLGTGNDLTPASLKSVKLRSDQQMKFTLPYVIDFHNFRAWTRPRTRTSSFSWG